MSAFEKLSVVVPNFTSDGYSEGAAFVQGHSNLKLVSTEERLRFKAAFYACWRLLSGAGSSFSLIHRLEAAMMLHVTAPPAVERLVLEGKTMIELEAQLELAASTVSTLREECFVKDMKLEQLLHWVQDIEKSDTPWGGDQIAATVRKFINEP